MSNQRLPYAEVLAARHALALNAVRIIKISDADADVLREAAAMLADEPRRVTPGYIERLDEAWKRIKPLVDQHTEQRKAA